MRPIKRVEKNSAPEADSAQFNNPREGVVKKLIDLQGLED